MITVSSPGCHVDLPSFLGLAHATHDACGLSLACDFRMHSYGRILASLAPVKLAAVFCIIASPLPLPFNLQLDVSCMEYLAGDADDNEAAGLPSVDIYKLMSDRVTATSAIAYCAAISGLVEDESEHSSLLEAESISVLFALMARRFSDELLISSACGALAVFAKCGDADVKAAMCGMPGCAELLKALSQLSVLYPNSALDLMQELGL